ncbi:MAG: HEPN domain-containing protein [Muribaculaceae bacterium]|nr:HEPN domain-containing protein [Muribaculaceae bacterium]
MTLELSQKQLAAKLLLEKSDKNMEQAIKTAELGYWDLVANRLYYAVFHAVNAMLLADGIKTGTHKGTSMQFGKSYVLTGAFKREDGILYGKLQTMREKADYQNVFTLEEGVGRELIESADELRKRICARVDQKICGES